MAWCALSCNKQQYLGLDAVAFLLEGHQAALEEASQVNGSLPFIGLAYRQKNGWPKGSLCQLLTFLLHGFLHFKPQLCHNMDSTALLELTTTVAQQTSMALLEKLYWHEYYQTNVLSHWSDVML